MPSVSQAQHAAMGAAAAGHSNLGIPKSVGEEFLKADKGKHFASDAREGAGIMMVEPAGRALFLRRANGSDHSGHWDFPGGGCDGEELPEHTATRETMEEIGALPYGERRVAATHERDDGFKYHTFHQPIIRSFTPRLSDEHDAYAWAPLSDPPKPLHPGIEHVMPKLAAHASGAIAQDFEESKIIRVPAGQKGGGEFAGSTGGPQEEQTAPAPKAANMTPAPANRESWPEHVKALKVPPAWTDLKINPDPEGDLLVTGKDKIGRRTAIYSDKFVKGQAAKKFARVDELNQKFATIVAENKKRGASGDPLAHEHSEIMDLVMQMGIRPGSESDRGGKSKAYGATTLEGRHVVETAGGVYLRFIGKKGVRLSLKVPDAALAEQLKARAAKAGRDGQLFPGVSEGSLLEYVHTFDGGGFTTKDFRTLLGTRTAIAEIAKRATPANEKEYKKAAREVAKVVSAKLGNTPVIALQSYINPAVFSDWRAAAEKGGTGAGPREHLHEMFKRITQPDGGFTYQPVSDNEPKAGYALSIYPDRSFAKPVDQLKFADLAKYVKANKDLFKQTDHYIGAWHDPESHQVFFDVSIVSDDERKAAELALSHDQIAYFDLAKGASVTVNKEATSGGAAKKDEAHASG